MTVATASKSGVLLLDPERTAHGYVRPGVYGIARAMSADGLWMFGYDERGPDDRWQAEYLPTGDFLRAATLLQARAKAGRRRVLQGFRQAAASIVAESGPWCWAGRRDGVALRAALEELPRWRGDRDAAATRYALARRRLDVLDGRLVAGDLDGVCACGGYLIGDVHGDACPACVELSPGRRIRCVSLVAHQACPVVDPVVCEHRWCTGRAGAAPCWSGDRPCCGCCESLPDGGASGYAWAVAGRARGVVPAV